ncbi:MAG: CvpA family protein [Candidatus Limnocylindrales bacterium]
MQIVGFIESFRFFDLIILFVLGMAFVLGFMQGTIRRILGIGSILFSFLLAANLRDVLGSFFAANWHQFPPQYSYMIAFGFVFLVASIAFSLVIQGFYKHQALFAKATAVDQLIGAVLGVVQALFIIGFGTIILDSFFRIPGIPQTTGELLFVRDLWSALDSSGTVHIFRDTLIPGFFTVFGVLIPADVRGIV